MTPQKIAAILIVWLFFALASYFAKSADFGTQTSELDTVATSQGALKSTAPNKGRVRICSWNVHNYSVANRSIGGKWREHPKPEAEKKALRKTLSEINADIVLIQEIGDEIFLKELRDTLAKEGLFYPFYATTSYNAHTRVAMLSRLAPEKFFDCSNISFKFKRTKVYSPRGTLGAKFKTADKTWYAYCIHLKSKIGTKKADEQFYPFRFAEVRAIDSRIFSISKNAPAIVAGDFNNEPSKALLRNFSKTGFSMLNGGDFASQNAYTYYWAKKNIPYIYDYFLVNKEMSAYVSEPKIINAKSAKDASDHLPVVVDLNFDGDTVSVK